MDYHDELILRLSELCGIVPEYWDIFGRKHETTIETRKAILKAMRLEVGSIDDIIREIRDRESRPWKDFVEPVQVISVESQPLSLPVYLPVEKDQESGLTVSWYLEREGETPRKKRPAVLAGPNFRVHEEKWIDAVRYVKVLLSDSLRRDIGYYTFSAECRHPEKIFPGGSNTLNIKSGIIVTPDACYIPPELEDKKVWGLSVNLYALNSKRNWGIGDLTDLQDTVRRLAAVRGSFVGINPLHALTNTLPFGASPYSPLSRLYRNFIYLDIERVPEVTESADLQKLISSGKFRAQINRLRGKEFIDYEAVAAAKEKVLRKAFHFFLKKHRAMKTKRWKEFQSYVSAEGSALESFAVFMALRGHFIKTEEGFAWQDWPEEYRSIDSQAVEKFRKMHARAILYYQYVQWLIDCQLKEILPDKKRLHGQIGLYFDLAVGSIGGGSDAWSYNELMAHGADVGAPPDDFSPDGQKWGFPPLIPEQLKKAWYDLFIRTIQKNMKYGGAIRIDHALGLFRIFWIPKGMSAKDGAYVQQPFEDLLRIIALESVRNKTMVIAEDLGTIGDNVREVLIRYRMLSYRLFYFERNYPDPSFLPPDKYPEMALCAVTTHDLPTLYGYWTGRDIETRRKLSSYSDEAFRKLLDEREQDKNLILAALRSKGLIPDDYLSRSKEITGMSPALCLAMNRYLAQTPCKLLLVSLDDLIGTINQQNLPGTVTEHPNWIQKTPLSLEEILTDTRLIELAEALENRYF
jgi:4-alpha-glucanotransferase